MPSGRQQTVGSGACQIQPCSAGKDRTLVGGRKASVAIMAAISMMVLIYSGAIALDLTNVYLVKSEDQRIADQSAIAGAFAYEQSSNSATAAANAASSLAVVNGAGSATVATSIVNSPSGDGESAVMVMVTSNVSLTGFGRATEPKQVSSGNGSGSGTTTSGGAKAIPVSAVSYAEIHGGISPPCIIALQSAGMTESGGVTTTATSCAVASNGPVSADSGAKITAQSIYAVTSIAATNGSTVVTSPTAGQIFPNASAQADPFAKSNVFSRLPTVAALTAPMFPSVGSAPTGGTAIQCSGTTTVGSGLHGAITATSYPTCTTLNFSGGAETDLGGGIQITGPSMTMNLGAGVYKINGLSNTGYGTVTINMTGNVTLYIWGGLLQNGSAAFNFNGTATYYVQGGITEGSSTALTFTNTNAASPSTFYVAGGIKVSNGSATFPNGTYVITSSDGTAGIDIGGGDSATFGNGSFNIAGGISTGGGSNLTIGNALYPSSIFQIPTVGSSGNAMNTGGGNVLTLGSFTNADFNGPVVIGGSAVTLGTGTTYTVNGAVNMSSSGGGSITGNSVSVIASGAISFGAGFNAVNISAPTAITSSTDGQASTVALASNSTSPFVVTAGASNTDVLGALYAPNAALQLSGAGNLNGGGACLQAVAASIALTGGSSISTTCTSLGVASSGGSVSLVQ